MMPRWLKALVLVFLVALMAAIPLARQFASDVAGGSKPE